MITMKMGALDMMRADSRIISALGPVDAGTTDDITAMVHALAVSGGPGNRFGLMPSTESRTWRYAPDAFLHEVVHLPSCTVDGLPALLTERARSACPSAALSVAVAGRYLIVDMSHGLGDARLITMLNQVLAERVAPQRLPDWVHARAAAHPLRTAIARFYGQQPGRFGALLHSRARTAHSQESSGELIRWRRAPVVVASRSDRAGARELRRRRDRLPERPSLAAVIFAALAGEIRSNGIDLADAVTVMFDCRRYLPTTSRVFGNFVSGVDLTVPDPADPAGLHATIAAATACGRPLAALALGSYTFSRRYRRGHGYDTPRCVPLRPRAKLVFSHIGDLFADSPMWTGDRCDRFCNVINEPGDPQAIVFTITRRGTDIDITASFHENVFSPALIQSALDGVLHAPQRRVLHMTGS